MSLFDSDNAGTPIPAGLLILTAVCVVALISVLVIIFNATVTFGYEPFPPRSGKLLAVFGAFLPVLIAFAVVESWPVSRYLIVTELLGLMAIILRRILVSSPNESNWVAIFLLSIILIATLYGLQSRSIRFYYEVLSGKRILDDNTTEIILPARHRRLLLSVEALIPYAKALAGLLGIAAGPYALYLIHKSPSPIW